VRVCFRVAEILDGKGAGKKGRFQGKVNKLQNRNLVESLLKDVCAAEQTWLLVSLGFVDLCATQNFSGIREKPQVL